MARLLIELQIGNRTYEYEVKNFENLQKVTLVPYPGNDGALPVSIKHEDITAIWGQI